MKHIQSFAFVTFVSILLSACASTNPPNAVAASSPSEKVAPKPKPDYASRVPKQIETSQKVIVVYPSVHAWGAYNSNGSLLKAGIATAGANWCPDINRACRTKVGSFRIASLGSASCKSSIYPLPRGGAPMPYCMFFNGNQGLHGSYNVVDGNASHGCVRLTVSDAEWVRFNFATIGTKVIVRPY